jgi:hypothetical protein
LIVRVGDLVLFDCSLYRAPLIGRMHEADPHRSLALDAGDLPLLLFGLVGIGQVALSPPCSSTGSLAMLAAICRASKRRNP